MGLANCDLCGKAFGALGNQRRCQPCLDAQERDWRLVRDYVKGNPGVSLEKIVEATEVPERRVREFITSGLLETTSINGATYPCRKCNEPIANGEYCLVCLGRLSRQISGSLNEARQPEAPKSSPSEARVPGFVNQYRSRHR